ncbi:MAG TPA: hypothetical protein VER03_21090, partial [Bryobacteraceae bacterium]|nr:hypothetical protein [Bryobacteraceae bacterium]
LTFVKANFSAQYKVDVVFFERPASAPREACDVAASFPGPKPTGMGPGVVFINGQCMDGTGSVWTPAGEMTLQAVPFEGYVFRGWTFDNTPTAQAQISSIQVKGPMMVHPRFEPGKRARFYTLPRGLKLEIDNTVVNTVDPERNTYTYPIPGYFDWVAGSRHVVSGVSPQVDVDNRTWVFKEWNNGGKQNLPVTVDDQTNVPFEMTATFVRGVSVSLLTEPAGLKLNIQGSDNSAPAKNFVWGVGMTYEVSAPAEQVDAKGRKYLFKGWSNGGATAQKITPDESQIASGIRMTAQFQAVPQAVISSSVPGMKIAIDGAECTAPCRLDRPAGTVLNLSVPQVVQVSEVSRYEFAGWSDGGPASRTFTVSADAQAVTAMYRASHRLLLASDPADGADLFVQPASGDGFYPVDTDVTITAQAKPGFRFRRWDGDLSGTSRSGVVKMSSARLVRALFDEVPFVSPTGVKNAAADLPEPGVAPGLIAIYGGSLAKSFEIGNAAPLAQTLGGTVVLVGDRLLPLVYVSPEQINAQLPADLAPGEYELVVRTDGMADVKSTFTVVRNAPGLFSNPVDSVAYAVALHDDGSPVTVGNPAKRNETISLLGTGFGPYDRRVLDGFAAPPSPVAAVVDPVEVIAGGVSIRPAFTGATVGLVGLTTTRFRVAAAATGLQEVKVVVNGRASNTVILPVE